MSPIYVSLIAVLPFLYTLGAHRATLTTVYLDELCLYSHGSATLQLKSPFSSQNSTALIKARRSGHNYPYNYKCKLLIRTQSSQHGIVASVRFTDFRENCVDTLTISDERNKVKEVLCGLQSYPSEEKNFTSQGRMTITFGTGNALYGPTWKSKGFQLTVTAYRSTRFCSISEFPCKNHRCISKKLVCDGHNHCGDNSDQQCGSTTAIADSTTDSASSVQNSTTDSATSATNSKTDTTPAANSTTDSATSVSNSKTDITPTAGPWTTPASLLLTPSIVHRPRRVYFTKLCSSSHGSPTLRLEPPPSINSTALLLSLPYEETYSYRMKCKLTILTQSSPPKQGIVASVRFVDFRENCVDNLTIYDENDTVKEVLCGMHSYKSEGKNLTSEGKMTIEFRSGDLDDGSTSYYKGFQLTVTAYRNTPTCSFWEFPCKNHRCISKSLICDGHNHCGDNSDEECAPITDSTTLKEDTTTALTKNTTIALTTPTVATKEPSCVPPFDFRCENGHCVPSLYVCDTYNDCGDWSDEKNCPFRTKISLPTLPSLPDTDYYSKMSVGLVAVPVLVFIITLAITVCLRKKRNAVDERPLLDSGNSEQQCSRSAPDEQLPRCSVNNEQPPPGSINIAMQQEQQAPYNMIYEQPPPYSTVYEQPPPYSIISGEPSPYRIIHEQPPP